MPPVHSIQLIDVTKKFGANRIFQQVNLNFVQNERYALTGPNGSGKSTLLKCIAGMVTPNQGEVIFQGPEGRIDIDQVFQEITFAAPYSELPEELNVRELEYFHMGLRRMIIGRGHLEAELELDPKLEIRNYSSGMKQRLKVALAFYTESSVLLLDEPTSNLDDHWKTWYRYMLDTYGKHRITLISSNEVAEYEPCDQVVDVMGYKPLR